MNIRSKKMAFDKAEIKQLKELLNDLESKIDQKMDQRFVDQRKGIIEEIDEIMDRKLSVQRFEIGKDTKSIIDEKLRPIHKKLDRFFEMESEDIAGSYIEVEKIKKRLISLEQKLALN